MRATPQLLLQLTSTPTLLASSKSTFFRSRLISQKLKVPVATQPRLPLADRPHLRRHISPVEIEYERLRGLARHEYSEMALCFERASHAYTYGEGARASSLARRGRNHKAHGEAYNRDASNLILRENNKNREEPNVIDLHGQYLDEAEQILEKRIHAAVAQGWRHLHVIVGRGTNSPEHFGRIRPKVEEICEEFGFEYTTGVNDGVVYLDLRNTAGCGGGLGLGYDSPTQNYYGYEEGYP